MADRLYAGCWHGGVRVVDVADIRKPKTIGAYNYHPPFPEPSHTFMALPKKIDGIDRIETLVIDDGSTDDTRAVAQALGVNHVVGFRRNQGLARAFVLGIQSCLERGADIIVNTDADNQYRGEDVETIVRPILEGRADFVIGARPIREIRHFSPVKKLLQRIGSWVVRRQAFTTTGPKVMLGTKRPSITSTWIIRAPPRSTARISSARRPRSQARMEGATITRRPC